MSAGHKIVISPDLFLYSRRGRYLWSPDRAANAWEQAYGALKHALATSTLPVTVHLVCGLQGSGKTTWIDAQPSPNNCLHLFFDATLPTVEDRRPVLSYGKAFNCAVHAIHVATPLDICLARNLSRSSDRQVPTSVINETLRTFEIPSIKEGYDRVLTMGKTKGVVIRANF